MQRIFLNLAQLITWGAVWLMVCCCGQGTAQTLPAANPLSALLPSTSFSLQLEEVIELPDSGPNNNNRFARIEQISPSIDGSGRMFVSDQYGGQVYTFTPGDASPSLFFNFGNNIPNFKTGNQQSGLRGFAFHPNAFTSSGTPGFRKLYTAYDITDPSDGHTSVVSEWTLKANGTVNAGSRRDVLTQVQPRNDHNIGKLAFNPNLSPTDPDYGNLYISFGDGGNFKSASAGGSDTALNPNAQDRSNFLGSMLRINPLESGANPYTVPGDNPFIGQGGVNPEIWAYGLRNPHQFSWDTGGDGKMLIADIGQSNIEELNLGVAGANYGWSNREGTFDIQGKAPDNPMAADVLPASHPTDPYTYPVAQFDHDFYNTGQHNAAIAGGFVYRGKLVSELRGKYVFGNFGTFGNFGETVDTQEIFVVDVDQLHLLDDFTNLSSLSDGFLAPIQKLSLVDGGGSPIQFLDLVRQKSGNNSQNRTDMRFGIDEDGEIYISSKKDGTIRRFVGTVWPDFDGDDDVDGGDFLAWQRGQSPDPLSAADLANWQAHFGGGSPLAASSTTSAVPEPATTVLFLSALAATLTGRRRRA